MTYWRWRGWCHCRSRWCNLVVGDFFPLWVRHLLPTPDFEPCLLISKSTEYLFNEMLILCGILSKACFYTLWHASYPALLESKRRRRLKSLIPPISILRGNHRGTANPPPCCSPFQENRHFQRLSDIDEVRTESTEVRCRIVKKL